MSLEHVNITDFKILFLTYSIFLFFGIAHQDDAGIVDYGVIMTYMVFAIACCSAAMTLITFSLFLQCVFNELMENYFIKSKDKTLIRILKRLSENLRDWFTNL